MLNAEDTPDLLVSRVATAVRHLREERGFDIAELAQGAGISTAALSELEAGDASPSIETLWAVARALGVPFGQLIEPPERAVQVIRAGDGVRVDAADAPFLARLLVSARRGGPFELYVIEIGQGPMRVAEPHHSGVREHVLVFEGALCAGPVDQTVDLGPGDLASYRADVEHCYETLAASTRALLVMDYG